MSLPAGVVQGHCSLQRQEVPYLEKKKMESNQIQDLQEHNNETRKNHYGADGPRLSPKWTTQNRGSQFPNDTFVTRQGFPVFSRVAVGLFEELN